MSRWLNGVSAGALVVSVAALAAPLPALAASFTVNTGATNTLSQTLNNGETGTVQSGGTLATSGVSITWSGANSVVTVTNSGTITSSGNRGFDTGTVTNGTLTFTNNAGATITSSNDALRISGSIGTGTVVINNYGTMTSTNNGRAVQADANTSTTGSLTINNFAGGLMQSLGDQDAIRPGMNGVVNNWGTINAAAGTGDGIDFQDRTATVNNMSGGLITAAKHGLNAGNGFINVNNAAGGTIIGRNGSGVGSDNANVTNAATVVNYGRITGAYAGSGDGDGDGVDIDGAATVTNYGIIEGTGAGGYDTSVTGNHLNNSEGISIGGGTVVNYGTISGASYGIVVNNDSNVSLNRSGYAATTVTNYGSIVGLNGYAIRFENKLGDSRDNDTIVNYGTITGNGAIPDPTAIVKLRDGVTTDTANGTLNGVTYAAGSARFIRGDGSAIQMGEGADQLTNYGTIIGNTGRAINMEGGNDTLRVMPGSKIVGLVDGGVGTDTLVYGKVGLTAAKMAALQAGQTVNIGGTLYTGFESFTGSVVQSFSSYATGATAGIAAAFDNGSTTQSASAAAQALMDQVASSSNPGAAMAQLTPTAFQALSSIGFNSAFQTTQLVGQRLSNLRQGGLAFDGSGLGTAVAMLGGERNRGLTPNQFDPSDDASSAYAAVNPMARNSAFDAMAKAGNYPVKAPRAVIDDTPWGMFIYGNALFARQNATANSPQSKFNAAGVTGGIDRRMTDEFTLGLLAGYSRTNADLDTIGSTSRINTWLLGAYASYARQNWYVDGAFIYGRNSYDNNRMALGTSNVSSPKGDQIALQSTFGIDYRFGVWTVTPEVGAQFTTVRVDGFTETGTAALAVQADRANSLRSSLGARFRYDVLSAWGKLTPELRASWQHEFLDKDRDVRASFVDQTLPGNFATTAAGSGTDFGVVGAGVNMFVADRTQLSVGYDFKFGGHSFTAHQLSGRLRHTF
jgi:uncharacterized protein with beta-barrel porin domain